MEKNLLNLALIQYDPKWEDVDSNLSYLSNLLTKLPKETDLVILPEAFSTGFSMNANKIAESMAGKAVAWMKSIAEEKRIAVCGSVFIEENNKYFNRFIWVHPEGSIDTYDKRHLFSMGDEHRYYSNGSEQIIILYKGWRIFPQVCYDLRFPVWSRNTNNYDLLINVANWPAARKNVWDVLLKARALENQCYVAAVNRIGKDDIPIEYSGNSMIIDYKGKVSLDANTECGIFTEQIDLLALQKFRKKFDTLKDADQFTINP